MEIALNKNGWHKKIQQYVFGRGTPIFNNFCPYFWLTIFCLLVTIVPIAPIFFGFRWLLIKICNGFERFADWFEDYICAPLFEKAALGMSEEELLRSWAIDSRYSIYYDHPDWKDYDFWVKDYFKGTLSRLKDSKKDVLEKKFEIWKEKNPSWEVLLLDIKERRRREYLKEFAENEKIREEDEAKEKLREERRAGARVRKQKLFVAIIKYTKWFVYIAGALFVAKLVHWGYLLTLYCMDHFYLDNFIFSMQVGGVILGAMLIILGIIFVIVKLSGKVQCYCDSKIAINIKKAIIWPFKQLWKFLGFFGTYILTVKKDYCPSIDWVEDNKQINQTNN